MVAHTRHTETWNRHHIHTSYVSLVLCDRYTYGHRLNIDVSYLKKTKKVNKAYLFVKIMEIKIQLEIITTIGFTLLLEYMFESIIHNKTIIIIT